MKIQLNTDRNIEGTTDLENYINQEFAASFDRFSQAITRLEVHLSDANAEKSGSKDKKCLIEARIANRSPLVVSHESDNIHQAINQAVDKMLRSLDNMAGKLTDRQSAKDFNESLNEE